ncbi:hypothetical protein FOMPIDRAFT_1047368 [Fomitopsis schrenkii]|uniref:Uncharacterized protein n=1 Tax=Fomitopsis schrenkii TaxID=2126942 RepID=S8FXM8_FOMSC|nr:hypothetical protein FOMPIDRAFT_1047368 [Fomitopsis schrenkii]
MCAPRGTSDGTPSVLRDAPAKPARPRPSATPASPPRDDPAANAIQPMRELARRPTPAEKAREGKLRADALCEIANPQLVRCRRCHSWIKLSAKSAFDPAHWNKHRERCVRRPESVVEELRETHDQQTPFPADVQPPIQPIMRKVLALTAPPPIADGDGDDASTTSVETAPTKEDSPLTQLSDTTQSSPPPSPTPAPTPPTTVAEPDPVFEEYLARSQRRPFRELESPLRKNWQEWSWATLRKPIWYPEHDSDDEGDDDRRTRVPVSHARASPAPERSPEDVSGAQCCPRVVHHHGLIERRDGAGAAGPMGSPAGSGWR